MNDIKRELAEVLEEQSLFSKESEERVIQKIQNPKKKSRKIWFTAISFAALLTIFIIGGLYKQNDSIQAQFTTYFEQKMDGKDYEVIFQEFDYVKKQDALVAFIERTDVEKIYLAYLEYKDGWAWQQTTGVTSKPMDNQNPWGSRGSRDHAPFMYAGIISNFDGNQIIVGQQEAEKIQLDNNFTYWFAVSDKAARIVVQNQHGQWKRLTDTFDTIEEDFNVPIVDSLSAKQTVLDLKTDTMDRGNKEYYRYPIVIDPEIDKLERGDIITYTNTKGQQTLSRVIGLPDETVEIINGTVVVNSVYFAQDYYFAKIMGETVYESYLEKLENYSINEQAAKEVFFYNFPQTTLGTNQVFVVPDNWARGTIEVISLDQLKGKVLGYEVRNFESEWSDLEHQYYLEFKKTNDIEVFRDVDPITYVRVQLYADFLMDDQTNYRMYTTREEYVHWSEQEYTQQSTISQNLYERLKALEYAQLIKKGEFQFDGEEGGIRFPLGSGDESIWRMVLSETGIWQSHFLPLQ